MKYRFTLPRDIYFGEESLAELKNLRGKRAMVVTGGHAMQKFGWLEKTVAYLKEAGFEVRTFEGVENDPTVQTVLKGGAAMREFQPDWIVAIGGGSPIDSMNILITSSKILLKRRFLFSETRQDSLLSVLLPVLVLKLLPSLSSQILKRASSILLQTSN